jgi:hypothetical protein
LTGQVIITLRTSRRLLPPLHSVVVNLNLSQDIRV